MKKLNLDLEKSIHFYTTNDSSVMAALMAGDMKEFWKRAFIAYKCNANILQEYDSGLRKCEHPYQRLHYLFTKGRAADTIEDPALQEKIIADAKSDIKKIIEAMHPAEEDMLVYRTTWRKWRLPKGEIPFSNVVKLDNIKMEKGETFDIPTFTSTSLTRYREDEVLTTDFYRFEIFIPKGKKVLNLDNFMFHNEVGEIVLPPARFKVHKVDFDKAGKRGGVIKLEYLESLEMNILNKLGLTPSQEK